MNYIQHDVHGVLSVDFITKEQIDRGWKVIDIDAFLKEKKLNGRIGQLEKMTRAELVEFAKVAGVVLEQNSTKAAALGRLIKYEQDKVAGVPLDQDPTKSIALGRLTKDERDKLD